MQMQTISWRSKVLNHRSKDFYFFHIYIFLGGSRRNFYWKVTDTHAWLIQQMHRKYSPGVAVTLAVVTVYIEFIMNNDPKLSSD